MKEPELLEGKYVRWDIDESKRRTVEQHGKIQKEGHQHACPYCGSLNRGHKYRTKGKYKKCEDCGLVSISRVMGKS